jgi:putative Mg2+ transporter-C (MgtC) family protein
MRLPLGILSGIGIIGAGAILRKGDRVEGVTTAATLWFVTVMGLCFGGGQLRLGTAAFTLGLFTLWVLKWIEGRISHEQRGKLILNMDSGGLSEDEVRTILKREGYKVLSCAKSYFEQASINELHCQVSWELRKGQEAKTRFLENLADNPHVLSLEWHPSEI